MANDDEAARAWLAAGHDARPRRPKFAEYDPLVAQMTAVLDVLGQILRTEIAAGGGKPPSIPPQPRPETAVERIRAELRKATHDSLVRRLLPGRHQLDD